MKRIFAFFICVCLGATTQSRAKLQVVVKPDQLFVGEAGQLLLTSTQGMPTVKEPPKLDNLHWLGGAAQNERKTIINGKVSYEGTYSMRFVVNQEGDFTIPAFDVEVNGKGIATNPVTITVKKRQFTTNDGKKLELEDMLFVNCRFGSEDEQPNQMFVGQETPLLIDLYIAENLNAQNLGNGGYPEIESESLSFREFPKLNQRNPKFPAIKQTRVIRDGIAFIRVQYELQATATETGATDGRGKAYVILAVPRNQSERDAPSPFNRFFMDDFGRMQTIQKTVDFSLPQIPVAPLPPSPADAGTFLGLIGSWRTQLELDKPQIKLGDAVAMTLTVEGQGNPHSFRAPSLNVDDFRIHGPEIEKNVDARESIIRATWVLIPENIETKLRAMKFTTFNPHAKTYETAEFAPSLKIEPNPNLASTTTAPSDSHNQKQQKHTKNNDKPKRQHDIFYLKTKPGTTLPSPIWLNRLWLNLNAVCSSLIFTLVCLFIRSKKDRIATSETSRRKKRAQAMKKQTLRSLINANGNEQFKCIRENIVPWLAAELELPPGTTTKEVAQILKQQDAELAEMLEHAEHAEFMPTIADNFDIEKITKKLKRMFTPLLVGTVLSISLDAHANPADDDEKTEANTTVAVEQQSGSQIKETTHQNMFDSAITAYDNNDFDNARKLFKKTMSIYGTTANLLYNLGNCAYQTGDELQALAHYEQAWKMKPRDADIRGNLEYLRRRLGLPQQNNPQNPGQLFVDLRDRIRPDEWMNGASILATISLLLLGYQLLTVKKTAIPKTIITTFMIIALTCGCIAAIQLKTSYRKNTHAILLVAENAKTAPSEHAAANETQIQPGTNIKVVKLRDKWTLLKFEKTQFWMPRKNIAITW